MKLLYIGQTNSLQSRMQEHLIGISRGNFCNKIKRRPNMSQKIEEYKVKYIKIENYRERCFFECELIGVYRPELNFTR